MAGLRDFLQMKVKFSQECKYQHIMYYKRHTIRQECLDIPSDRTLFIINVPVYCTENMLRQLFGLFGPITTVYQFKEPVSSIPDQVKADSNATLFQRPQHEAFYDRLDVTKLLNSLTQAARDRCDTDNTDIIQMMGNGFRIAYIVYKTTASLMKAVKESCDDTIILANLTQPPVIGLKKWCQEYAAQRPAPSVLQSQIDQYMEDFNKRQELKESQNSDQPDDEGWITVKRKYKYPVLPNGDQEKPSKKKKKKKTELINFYRFEIRESKREHIAQLRKKFEEDKKKIAMMKEARRFKPY